MDATKYEVFSKESWEIIPVTELQFRDEEVVAVLENGEEVVFANPKEEGNLRAENDSYLIRQVETEMSPNNDEEVDFPENLE